MTSPISNELTVAASQGDAATVERLLSDGFEDRREALFWACILGRAECARLLLPDKIDPDTLDSQALGAAAGQGHSDCVAILLPLFASTALEAPLLSRIAFEAREAGHADAASLIDSFREALELGDMPNPARSAPSARL